eukprot:SAG11_NODE_114_length_16040_cov_10.050875_1_plen_54_part_00
MCASVNASVPWYPVRFGCFLCILVPMVLAGLDELVVSAQITVDLNCNNRYIPG